MRKILTSLALFLVAFFTFSVASVSAKVLTAENGSVTVGKAEVVNDDLFIGAQTAIIDGTVNGDVFIGAQTVKITGIVNGSLHIGANTIDITGKVKGNVYAGAQNILVSGANIGGSLVAGAATLNLDKSTVVGGAVIAGAGSITSDAQVKRSVYAGTGMLTLGADTRIGKDLYYAAGNNQNQASIAQGAKISGNIYKSEVNTAKTTAEMEAAKKQIPAIFGGIRLGSSIISFIGALIVGFIYLRLFGKHFTETSEIVTKSFWKSLGIGFLVTIAFVPGLIILLITIIGIPIAGLAFLLLLLDWYLAKIVVGSAFGNWISMKFNRKMSVYGSFAVGLLAIYILKFIPIVGGLAGIVVLWSGLGALTLKMFSKSQ